MDKDLANIIRNNIPNDYCKKLCLDVMEEENERNSLSDFRDEKIMLYCLIYGDSYFVNRIYKEKDFSKISHSTINFRYIYLYNLFKENKHDEELEEELFVVYSNKKEMKKLNKEINSLSMINFYRKLIRFYYKKYEDEVIKNSTIINLRLDIISSCIEYKVLTKILFLEENNKIDRLLNWNISRVMRCNTIEDKLWLM